MNSHTELVTPFHIIILKYDWMITLSTGKFLFTIIASLAYARYSLIKLKKDQLRILKTQNTISFSWKFEGHW